MSSRIRIEKFWRRFRRRRSRSSSSGDLCGSGSDACEGHEVAASIETGETALDSGSLSALCECLLTDAEQRAVRAEGNPVNTIFAEIMMMEDMAVIEVTNQRRDKPVALQNGDIAAAIDDDLAEVLEDTYHRLQQALIRHREQQTRQRQSKEQRAQRRSSIGRFRLQRADAAEVFDVNGFLEDGDAPLHVLARRGRTRCLELLLSNGADPNSEPLLHLLFLFHSIQYFIAS